MTRRHAWIAVLGIALVAGCLALGVVAVQRLDFFRIRSVEVVGARHLNPADLVARLGIPGDAHILVPLEPIAASARALPGVRAAEANRRWPGTIRVTIREAPAVALAVQEGRVLVIDDRAGVLPVDPARLETSLPIAERDSAVAALLGRIQVTDPQWYRLVDRAARDGRGVRLEAGPWMVRLAASADGEVIRHLAAVRDYLAENGIGWREIDARFKGRMFVRKEAA